MAVMLPDLVRQVLARPEVTVELRPWIEDDGATLTDSDLEFLRSHRARSSTTCGNAAHRSTLTMRSSGKRFSGSHGKPSKLSGFSAGWLRYGLECGTTRTCHRHSSTRPFTPLVPRDVSW
jgi:hypothetical protein